MSELGADCTYWHRFLVVVLSAYKQIRAQSTNVLADIDEDNFDKAFMFFRPGASLAYFLSFVSPNGSSLFLLSLWSSAPFSGNFDHDTVIQGGADMGKKLSEDEVQRALDFCVHLFSPTTPEQHESVRRQLLASQWDWPNEADEHDDGRFGLVQTQARDGDRSKQHEGTTHTMETLGKQKDGNNAKATAERLLDVKSPIIDPSALAKLLRSRLPSLPGVFRRTDSSSSTCSSISVSGGRLFPTLSSLSLSSSSSSSPSSPVSAVFSMMSTASVGSMGSVGLVEPPEVADGGADDEVKMVLDKVNARRVIHAEHGEGLNSLEQEAVGGLVIRLERGRLGLVRVDAGESD